MIIYISLLRGINVSGQNKIKMAALKVLYEGLDLEHVATYIQSGNVMFASSEANTDELAAMIHDRIQKGFGYSVGVMVRTLDEWRELISENPFVRDGSKDIAHLHATLLSDVPAADSINALSNFSAGADEFKIRGQMVYLHCPNGYGRTRLNNSFWEKKLNTSATTRNWKTVNKLLELAEAITTG